MKTNASISRENRLCIKRYSGQNVDVQTEKCSVQVDEAFFNGIVFRCIICCLVK